MDFQVGEQVIHRVFGLGEIILIEEKNILGRDEPYYVVRIGDLTLWVPVGDMAGNSLRSLTPLSDFETLYAILSGPGHPLSTDHRERKLRLADRMEDGKLASLCQVVRDLTSHRLSKKLNENDMMVFGRAHRFLLNEWAASLSIPVAQARNNIDHLLDQDIS